MQIILTENVDKLGRLGDIVQVKPGYARNYLLPKGIGRMASPANVQEIEARRAELERAEKERRQAAEQRQQALEGRSVTVRAKVGTEGKLFGSVSAGDIAEALSTDEVQVEKREVRLPEGPLRETGEFEVALHLYSDLDATVTVVVEPEA